jgi:hypothetical protein
MFELKVEGFCSDGDVERGMEEIVEMLNKMKDGGREIKGELDFGMYRIWYGKEEGKWMWGWYDYIN